MRYRSKGDECDIHERVCAGCGKNFVVAAYHSYKLGSRLYCSYTCWMRAKEEKAAAHRAMIEERKKKNGQSRTPVPTTK